MGAMGAMVGFSAELAEHLHCQQSPACCVTHAGKARDAGLVDAIWRLADHLECDIITLCFLFRKLFCQHRFVGTKASSLVDHSGHRLMS